MFKRAEVTAEAPEAATSAETKAKPKNAEDMLKGYRSFCYNLLGQRLDNSLRSEELAERLKQAGLNVTPGLHYSVEIVTVAIAGIVSLVVGLVLFVGIIHPPHYEWGFVGVLVLVAVGATVAAFQSIVSSRISNRKTELEKELPFTLSELSVMASTGMPPIELMRRMARRAHDPMMTGEFKKIVYKTDVQGKDLITALAETAKESPSTAFRESLWDLANMIHQGGNLDEYLRNKSDDVLKLKRLVQKEFIERLQTFVDMYVSLVLVGVLMLAVAAFLLNAFQSTFGGLDSNELLLLLTYGIVPLAVVMTSVMITMAYGKAQ